MKFFAMFFVLTASMAASAAGTHDCTNLDSIGNLIGQTVTVGNVKLAYVSTEEPAAAPDHLLVFIYDNHMGSSCTAISNTSSGYGFGSVDMNSLKSTGYDAKEGRSFEITVALPNIDGLAKPKTEKVRFRTNSVTGKVSILN